MHDILSLLLTSWLLTHTTASSPAPPRQTSSSAAVCPPATRDEKSWKTVMDESGRFELRLPATMKLAEPGKYSFMHGGQTWEDEHRKVSLSFGQWSEDSFASVTGKRCRLTRGGAKILVITEAKRVLAWHGIRSGSGPHEPIVSASSDVDDAEHLAAIALSLKRRASS